MNRRLSTVVAVALLVAACGRLGLGDQRCEEHVREPSPANVLAAQAVPTARYTPCFNSLDFGWDDIDFEAENGRAGIAIQRGTKIFLTAVVTESCDTSQARQVVSGYSDITKFVDVEEVRAEVAVLILPVTDDQYSRASNLAVEWSGSSLEGRRLSFAIDPNTTQPLAPRIETALERYDYVWIIDELDDEEQKLEMRAAGVDPMPGLSPEDALDVIEDEEVTALYRGNWYFTFEGGCITYTFDAEGQLAESVAEDATNNLGFYPAFELSELSGG